MSKILLATAILAAYEAAKTHDEKDAVLAQVIDSVKEQEALNADHTAVVEKLKADYETLQTSKTEVDGLLEKANADLENSTKLVEDLGLQLDAQAKAPGAFQMVTHDKKSYKIIGSKFLTRKGELNAEELAKDKELIGEMIKNGSGALVLEEKK